MSFLLDLEMPRMDGFAVFLQYIREDADHKDLPVIMITSRTGDKHRKEAFNLGVTEFMGKPFQENELMTLLDNVLS